VLTGTPTVAGDRLAVDLAEPTGLADPAPPGDVLRDRFDRPGVEVRAGQGGPLALEEPGLAGAAAEHAAALVGPVAAGHAPVSGVAVAAVESGGIQAAEAGRVVDGAVGRVRSLGLLRGSGEPGLYPIEPVGCDRILLANSRRGASGRSLGKMGPAGKAEPPLQTPRSNSPTVSDRTGPRGKIAGIRGIPGLNPVEAGNERGPVYRPGLIDTSIRIMREPGTGQASAIGLDPY
jgi:hypothetical protein